MATEPASGLAVQATGLRKVYGEETPFPVEVLRGVDLEIRTGEFVAVIGQSGSGKSTLLNLLGALDRPTCGTVTIGGIDLAGLGPDELADLRNTSIGFVFQFHHLLPEFNCLENALMPLSIRREGATPADVRRVTGLLQRVGLGDQLKKRPSKMSGGQQQRTAIIRALAAGPRLVLADEPTGNLDTRSGHEVFEVMREMAAETGVAFVMVTHDERLARAADRVLHIEDGLIHTEDFAGQ